MKLSHKLLSAALSMSLIFMASSCSDDNNETPTSPADPLMENFQLIGTATIDGHETVADVYAKEDLYAGYNTIAVRPRKGVDGEVITEAAIQFKPMMNMASGMQHSAPYENPVYNEELNAFVGSVTFIMPTTQMGDWKFSVEVDEPGDHDHTVSMPITVVPKEEARVFSFVSNTPDSTIYYVALMEPMAPEVGLNDYQLAIYKRKTMMEHPFVGDLEVEIEPEMPTMGHGSPNNENPHHHEKGHYHGKVNFTMTGYWKVNMTFKNASGEMVKDNAFFDITFQ